jgi:manganese transport protein
VIVLDRSCEPPTEVSRERFPGPVKFFLWLQAEVITIAIDLAEVIGAALALILRSSASRS